MIRGGVEIGEENLKYVRSKISLNSIDEDKIEHYSLNIPENSEMVNYAMSESSWDKFIRSLKKINQE